MSRLSRLSIICAGPDCGTRFRPKRSDARTCSDRCRQARSRALRAELARNDWHSPAEVVEAARAVMGGIDLDPASCEKANRTVQAARFYTIREDGLRQPWAGRVWLNPPYGKSTPKFVARLAEHLNSGAVTMACLLLSVGHLTTGWFRAVDDFEHSVCMPNGRLRFSGSKSSPTHGSVVLGFGVDHAKFARELSVFGRIWRSEGEP